MKSPNEFGESPSAIIRAPKRAQIGILDDDIARMAAGDVEGLGGGGHHHQPVGDPVDLGHRDVRMARHH
jgi:hypothetical protein